MQRLLWIVSAAATLVFVPRAAPAIVAAPAPTPPPGQTVTYTYKTYLEPGRVGPGLVGNLNESFGTLRLTFNGDKIIQGTYRPDFGNFTSVTGGIVGPKELWLSFGAGGLRFSGHFTRHGIVADSQGLSAGGRYWRLHAQYAGAGT